MSMIFPGMDPYLEEPQIWTGVHATLIVYIRDQIQPRLRPRYLATVEERVYLEGPDREIIPDVWLRENQPVNGNGAMALREAVITLNHQEEWPNKNSEKRARILLTRSPPLFTMREANRILRWMSAGGARRWRTILDIALGRLAVLLLCAECPAY